MHAILTRTITLVLDRKLFSRRIFLLIEIRTELRELGFFETTLTVHGARAPRLLVSTCHRHTIRMLTRCRTYSIYILACCCAVLPTCAETRLGRAALRLQGPAAATQPQGVPERRSIVEASLLVLLYVIHDGLMFPCREVCDTDTILPRYCHDTDTIRTRY